MRWIVGHVLKQPLTWLWIALAIAAWPTIILLAPRALLSDATLQISLFYEIAFIGLLISTLVGAILLERGAWFMKDCGRVKRVTLELAALSATTLVLLLPTLALPIALGWSSPAELPAFALRAGLCQLHLASLVILLLRIPIPNPVRICIILLGTWALPAITNPATLAARFVVSNLNAGGHLIPGFGSVLADLAWKPAIAPIMGLLGAALLLRPLPPLHALRHSR